MSASRKSVRLNTPNAGFRKPLLWGVPLFPGDVLVRRPACVAEVRGLTEETDATDRLSSKGSPDFKNARSDVGIRRVSADFRSLF